MAIDPISHAGLFGRRTRIALRHDREQLRHRVRIPERDPDGGAMRAHLHTGRSGVPAEAEIALGSELDFLFEYGMAVRDVDDVSPRAPPAAVTAADAGQRVDRDLRRADRTRDRARRAPDHA